MEKLAAVLALDTESATHPSSYQSLGQPSRLRAALKANDRLKLYLSLLQAAAAHAHAPQLPLLDLQRDVAAAGVTLDADWLQELPAGASLQGAALQLPGLPRLAALLADDLGVMAAPLLQGEGDAALAARVVHWQAFLHALPGAALEPATLDALTHGQRGEGDSLHLTVMDLHKALNQLAASLSTASVDGAHAWQLAADGSDAPRVAAFMRGLNRSKPLKLDHPGLDTAATRDGAQLLIQNDIGTNDAHVLVIQVQTERVPASITLTYSDLHRQRFAFFQQLLAEVGADWGEAATLAHAGLNQGEAFHVGHAHFIAASETELQRQLEGIGERIVFLIDWNRARKRLLPFVGKDAALAVLAHGAQQRCGHMAWLRAGGDTLVWQAMAAQGSGVFRLGDRLDEVLGADSAREFLCELLEMAHRGAQLLRPPALLADEARAALARRLQHRHAEYDELEEHAGLCQALAQALDDALAQGHELAPKLAGKLAARAKTWERQADHLVMRARAQAERLPQWQPLVRLIERSDDVADALEEACFVFSLAAEHYAASAGQHARHAGWHGAVRESLRGLAASVLAATQDHVRCLVIARALGADSEASDHDEFLAASWRVVQAERRADEQLRELRRALVQAAHAQADDSLGLSLAKELAIALEQASDALLVLAYGLRERAFQRIDLGQP